MGKVTIVQRSIIFCGGPVKRTSRQVVFLKSTPSYIDNRDNHQTLLQHVEQYLHHSPWLILTVDAAGVVEWFGIYRKGVQQMGWH